MADSSCNKIIFISHEASRTGAPIMLLHFLKWLKANTSFSFEIVLRNGGALLNEFQELGQCHVLSRMTNTDLIELLKRYQAENIKLVYSNTISNGAVQAFFANLKCPQICHVHELDYVISVLSEENFNKVNQSTNTMIAASHAVKRNLVERRNINPDRITVVHEFIKMPDLSYFSDDLRRKIRQEMNIPDDAFIIGGSANAEWRKGVDLFLQTAKFVNKSFKDKVYYVWLGFCRDDDYVKGIFHDVEKSRLSRYMRFTGPKESPLDYVSVYDIFVMSSREDPFPLAAIEAAALGKPVLCFEGGGGIPELVEQDAGFVIPYLDTEEMAKRAIQLLQNPDLRYQFGNNAVTKVKNSYTVEVLAPKLFEEMLKVMEQNRPVNPCQS